MKEQRHEWLANVMGNVNLTVPNGVNPLLYLNKLIDNKRITYIEVKDDEFAILAYQIELPKSKVVLIDHNGVFAFVKVTGPNKIEVFWNSGIKDVYRNVNMRHDILHFRFNSKVNFSLSSLFRVCESNVETFRLFALDSYVTTEGFATMNSVNNIVFTIKGIYVDLCFGELKDSNKKIVSVVCGDGNESIGFTRTELETLIPFLITNPITKPFMNRKFCKVWYMGLFGKKISDVD